ncbi:MAG TPA: hypothetical protein VFV58_35360 [Blastocatellia bacterium]|jgi:hypothetical protein|nr:hypothetical protein [Blastocatellia bacterium]
MNRTEHEGEIEIERTRERANSGPNGGRQRDSIFKQIRTTAADKLQAAAQTLHQKADRSGQPTEISALGHRTADWLERSADYVSEMEPQRLKSDIESQVRRNPGRSLLIAGIVGLALGGLLRRR